MHTYMHMRMRMLFASTTNVYPAYPAHRRISSISIRSINQVLVLVPDLEYQYED